MLIHLCFMHRNKQDGVQRVMEAAILQQGDPVEVTHGEFR